MFDSASAPVLLGALAGGVGLFLLGMTMMTDGMKLAAGPALERILADSTRTRPRALASGMLMTALVQSSSAVTVAAIGFVNAGLLSLSQALWVLFGSNVGTTVTGWLVALVGLKVQIEALALPLIGVGALLRLSGERQRRGALGQALAGFGLLFLGIDLLRRAFTGLADGMALPQGSDALTLLALVAAGALLTVLMQASAATMTLALTAAQGGMIGLQGAAALIIGANIGTTVTALLATIGATPNARRAAAAHVIFNLLTAAVALALLPWLVAALDRARLALAMGDDPAALLALFHTVFNVLGVLLMWPLTERLTRFLLARFRSAEEDESRPRHLDDNVLAVPVLALDALQREVQRIGQVTLRMLRAAAADAGAPALERDRLIVAALQRAVASFVERMHGRAMSSASGQRLPQILRVARYHEAAAEHALEAAQLGLALASAPEGLQTAGTAWRRRVAQLVDTIEQHETSTPIDAALAAMEADYQVFKAALLEAGAVGALAVQLMETRLRAASALRRAAQQAAKAGRLRSLSAEAIADDAASIPASG